MKTERYTHRTDCRVIYGDTDNMGYAYHANYFRWFEIGRTEMLRALGVPYKQIEENGIFLPVSEAHCKFVSPVQYDDLLIVETTLDSNFKAGFKFDYRILGQEDGEILARGYTKHPCVNGDGKVVRPPKFLMDVFLNLPSV
jgi:acyl-CoA thioester hydrolase